MKLEEREQERERPGAHRPPELTPRCWDLEESCLQGELHHHPVPGCSRIVSIAAGLHRSYFIHCFTCLLCTLPIGRKALPLRL